MNMSLKTFSVEWYEYDQDQPVVFDAGKWLFTNVNDMLDELKERFFEWCRDENVTEFEYYNTEKYIEEEDIEYDEDEDGNDTDNVNGRTVIKDDKTLKEAFVDLHKEKSLDEMVKIIEDQGLIVTIKQYEIKETNENGTKRQRVN